METNKTAEMWEPIVKDNKLYGLSLNPLGKEEPIWEFYFSEKRRVIQDEQIKAWRLAESQRRLVEVDEAEYEYRKVKGVDLFLVDSNPFIISGTFTADESNGKLINLKLI